MLTQSASVCKGWRRLVFSLRSSLTLTHSLASTLSQTCWTAAFAWRCHSSFCRSDDGRKWGEREREGESELKKKRKKKPWDSPKKCLRFVLIFPPFLLPLWLSLSCLTSSRKKMPCASMSQSPVSPPLPSLQSPPFSLLINKTDLQEQCGDRLRQSLARVPT